jgi:hypothetical protein
VTLFTILWTIKILCNAHLCIHNIVPGVSLSHENYHYTKLIARDLQFRANYPGHGIKSILHGTVWFLGTIYRVPYVHINNGLIESLIENQIICMTY